MFEYQLIRSKRRRTLSLQVKYGQVTVRAPYSVSSTFIDSFIEEKSAWLRAKLVEQQSALDFCDYSQGSSLLYLGEQVSLNISIAKKSAVYLNEIKVTSLSHTQPVVRQLNVIISEKINVRLNNSSLKAQQVKKQLEGYFKRLAEDVISQRLELISKQTLLMPSSMNIRQYKSRWGSCTNLGALSFNYLLMMTPLFVIDYVVVHELCHLEHLDHSKNFWQLVERHCPDYQIAKQWLNSHQSQLYWKKPL
ncbi:M48 family metallopeptidase [Colwellia psychrerythraea]|uniref:YgjP-like metallopeptidase domain-containing protein n=1 Tax=Colwellia psychrerythraea TaxID=28229 RepID=A0A099KJX7_COLPS|nr:SprT family zinc-dependent metalloprotease [Colwellia psychrerythraea]KGJ90686.1 protein of unknown function DUF45 [Colwellia psychrerythraea]